MPVTTIPLVGAFTRRLGGASTVDQQYSNIVFVEAPNEATSTNIVYAEKRNGLVTSTTPESGSAGNGVFRSPSLGIVISSFFNNGTSTATIYDGTTSVGSYSSATLHISEAVLNSTTYIFFTNVAQEGYFYVSTALGSFVGDTHTNTVIDNISSTTNLYVGQPLSGTGIQAGTRIASITSGTAITVTLATTATNSGVTITSGKLSKIISANFPTNIVGPICEMDGFIFVGTSTARVYNSDINNPVTWGANSYISANAFTDNGVGALKYKNKIGFFGTNSLEWFYNGGTGFGSPLIRQPELAVNIGCVGGTQLEAGFAVNYDYLFWSGTDGILYQYEDGAVPITDPGTFLRDNTNRTVMIFSYRGLTVVSICAGSAHTSWYYPRYKQFSDAFGTGTYARVYLSSAINSDVTFANALNDTSGKVFTIGQTNSFQDNGAAFTLTIQTQPYYLNNGEPFIIDEITLLADTQSGGSSLLESTANDYGSFGTIGSFDLTQQQKNLSGGGYYDSSVAFKLTDSGNNAWRGQGLKIKWRPYA